MDTLRFLTTFYAIVTSSAPHIYISALPFSPSESLIWRNTEGSFRSLLHMKEGRLKAWPGFPHVWRGHSREVMSIACSPDGLRVASGSQDQTVRIWDMETGETLGRPLIGHEDGVYSVAFSTDSHLVVSCSKYSIRAWDARTGDPEWVRSPPLGQAFTAFACSSNDQYIVTGSDSGAIQLWELSTGEAVGAPLIGHSRSVRGLAYSSDGSKLVSGSDDETTRVWSTHTRTQIGQSFGGHTGSVLCTAFSLAMADVDLSSTLQMAAISPVVPTMGSLYGISTLVMSSPGFQVDISIPSPVSATHTMVPYSSLALLTVLSTSAMEIPTNPLGYLQDTLNPSKPSLTRQTTPKSSPYRSLGSSKHGTLSPVNRSENS